MATGVVSWSQTAASNDTADSNVNWAEGQLPSTVNNSARAMMASVAKFRDDTSGGTATAGTSAAYTFTSSQGLSLTAGTMISFQLSTSNAATPTINVDSLGAKPLRPAPGVEFAANVLRTGVPYEATYFTSNSGEWIVKGQSLYKEGTFTPALSFNDVTTGITYSTQSGRYSRTGNTVFFSLTIVLTSNGSGTGVAKIRGLPYENFGLNTPCSMFLNGGAANGDDISGYIPFVGNASGDTTIELYYNTDGTAYQLDDGNITDTTTIHVSGAYYTTAAF